MSQVLAKVREAFKYKRDIVFMPEKVKHRKSNRKQEGLFSKYGGIIGSIGVFAASSAVGAWAYWSKKEADKPLSSSPQW